MAANRSVGEVDVTIGATSYIVRYGNRELARLEKLWAVNGIADIYKEAIQTSSSRFIEFAVMGLSRHHPVLTPDEVADLLDYRDEDERRPLVDAVIAAFEAVIPKARTSARMATTEATPTTVQ